MTSELIAATEQGAHWLAGRLLAASLQGALVIGLVWLVSWRFASMPPSVRALLWWLASLKLLLAVTLPAVSVPVLPAGPQAAVLIEAAAAADLVPTVHTATGMTTTATADAVFPGWSTRSKWIAGLLALWLLGVGAHALVLLVGIRRVRRLLAASIPAGGDVAELARRLGTEIGLRAAPDVRLSEEVDTPQVVRARRPVILLPSSLAGSMTAEERAMVLCHELVHVRRHDLLIGCVPACAERIFFFHPLARLAAREFVLAREAICDAAVLHTLGVAPREYGHFLLRLGIRGSHPEPGAAAAASRSASSLRRRLDMLHHVPHLRPRRMVWLAAALAICAVPPLQLVARSPEARNAGTSLGAPAPPSAITAAQDQPGALVRKPAVEIPSDLLAALRALDSLQGNVSVEGWVELDGRNVSAADLTVKLASQLKAVAADAAALEAKAAAEARRSVETAQKAIHDASSQDFQALIAETQASLALLAEESAKVQQSAQIEQAARAEQKVADPQSRNEELQKRLQEMAAQLRELERSLNQERALGAERAVREVRRLEERVSRLQEIDRSRPLDDQVEQLRRMQELVMAQMNDLIAQQKALQELQEVLKAEGNRIREAMEQLMRERAKSAAPAK